MKDQDVKDTLLSICQILTTHVDQMLELQRRTIALVAILDAPSKSRWAKNFDFPEQLNLQTVDALKGVVAGQHLSLDSIIQKLKDQS
jgi:hypothetical protein